MLPSTRHLCHTGAPTDVYKEKTSTNMHDHHCTCSDVVYVGCLGVGTRNS